MIESGAGAEAGLLDSAYEAKGAKVLGSRERGVRAGRHHRAGPELRGEPRARQGGPRPDEARARSSSARPSRCRRPISSPELAKTKVNAFGLELIPRTTRAQAMDILSSMATVAGYRAVLWAAERLPKFFPMFMTAAGTVAPARVFVVGAGVAGLQAIATAKRLGADRQRLRRAPGGEGGGREPRRQVRRDGARERRGRGRLRPRRWTRSSTASSASS